MAGFLSDLEISDDGRRLVLTDSSGVEFRQRARAACGFTRGTYRYNRHEGFPASVQVLGQQPDAASLSALIRLFLVNRPNVAEVYRVRVRNTGRAFTVQAEVQLRDGTSSEFTA
jgi:hypothetical protein